MLVRVCSGQAVERGPTSDGPLPVRDRTLLPARARGTAGSARRSDERAPELHPPPRGLVPPPRVMTDRGSFAVILDEYLRALEAGNAPDREALLVQHPEVGEELRAALKGIDFVHGAGPRLAPEQDADSPPAEVLGDYRLIRELGRGGMAVVYEAEQISLARRVALKVLPFAAVLDPKQLQRFKNEAVAAAHLRHPNIVPVYGVGCERGVHYYAMQYVEGQNLATAIHGIKQG